MLLNSRPWPKFVIADGCEITSQMDPVDWETSLLESTDVIRGYIILHHVCSHMSAQQRTNYMKSVEKGTHRDQVGHGDEHAVKHGQTLVKNNPHQHTTKL